jgi:dihydrofolate synthase/folylpolyglutamate synthase
MSYQELLTYLYGLGRFGMKPGTERISRLLDSLNNPQDSFTSVHVAGTNGKGSTAAFLASVMSRGGYRTGLFTSPHLSRFSERMRVDGCELSEEVILACAERVMGAAPEGTTFFELVTGLAILAFAESGVELAVLEAGMGGRFDATGAVPGAVTVITTVGLDHCQYLGASIGEIAAEKAGIITPGRPVVTAVSQPEALASITSACAEHGSSSYRFGAHFNAQWSGSLLAYRGMGVSLDALSPGIGGRYQAANAACALAAAELLSAAGFPVSEDAMRAGIETASWPGRMELVGEAPRVLLDGAHNPDGARALAAELAQMPHSRLCLVAGVMCDKDAAAILAPLLPLADMVCTVAPSLERSMPASELAGICRRLGAHAVAAGSVAEGLEIACGKAGPDGLVVVCGSLFAVGEARSLLLHHPYEPVRG